MNPVLAQWLPVIVMIIAIWVGLIYKNKRLDDFKDLLRAEVGKSKAELQGEIVNVRSDFRREITHSEGRILQAKAELRADVQALERRVQRARSPFAARLINTLSLRMAAG